MPPTARATDGARARRLAALRALLPPSAPWEAWLADGDEAPPDFSRLASRPGLWSPVEGLAGLEGWPARRSQIRSRWRRWLLGTMAPAPGDLSVETTEDSVGDGVRLRRLVLRCAEGRGVLRVRVIVPVGASVPPPVLLTQTNHDWWAAIAVRRGWAAGLVSACDGDDDTDSLLTAYPGLDWSRLARRAWALSRALDALDALPELDAGRVVLAGHSRNGKAALIAAAHDERFAAVVSSSAGVMGAIPARLCADRHFGEGIELLTRHYPDWFHGRLRFFSGREHLLPTDAHELLALVAPRPLLLSVAVNDQVESTWAAERTLAAVAEAYRLLGAEDRLALRWRTGGHEATREAVERHLDWAETAVGHGPLAAVGPPEPPLHPLGWRPWPRSATRPAPGWAPGDEDDLRAAVGRALGAAPPSGGPPIARYGLERPHVAALLHRDRAVAGVEKRQIVTGEGVNVDLWLPAVREAGVPLPVVLWLAPLCRATGYVGGLRAGHAAV